MRGHCFNRDLFDAAKERLRNAEKVWDDFTGERESRGLTLAKYGDYITVDDDQDRWLAPLEDYESALNDVLAEVLAGTVNDDDGDLIYQAYTRLCSACPAMFSRIGAGSYNDNIPALVEMLRDELTEKDFEAIVEDLGIEVTTEGGEPCSPK